VSSGCGERSMYRLTVSSECLSKQPKDQKSFGNEHCRIDFRDRDQCGVYGRFYHFFLHDAVDVGEYLVLWDSFVALASNFRLRVKYRKTFHEVFQDERDVNGECLLKKMGVLEQNGDFKISAAEWAIARKRPPV